MIIRKHITFALLATLLCWLTIARAEAQVVVEAHADTASILIGEQIQVSVKCTVNAKQQVTFPQFQPQHQLTKGVEVVGCGRVDTVKLNNGQRLQLTRRYTITSFDSAMYRIPPFQVKVDGKTYQSRGEIGLKVNTVEVDLKHPEKFNGPHDVVEQPFEWSWLFLASVVGCVIILLLVIALAIRLTDPRLITRKVLIMPPTPAHVTALNNINQIKSKTAMTDAKQYYMELTETLRSYIQSRFGFNAREMTTSEIVEHLCGMGNEAALAELKNVLLTADLVKFAKHTTTLPEQDRSLMQALDYVQATKIPAQELPKPKVEIVSLSNKKQIMWRNCMRICVWLLSVVMLLWLAYNVYQLYCCFA